MNKFISIILKAPAGAPGEFQILPEGKIDINGDDPAYLDENAALGIIAAFRERGNDMVIDYEHQTLTNGQAPAAGWIRDLVWKGKEGLWALADWTNRAKEYLENREYRYFSPVMLISNSDRKVVRLINVALTNSPAINNLKPIIAKMTIDEARAAQEKRSRKYGIAVKEGGHVTKPGEWANVPDDEFLDPVNYRYPCPDAAQTRAAASYWGQEKNREQYTAEERAKIDARLDKFRGKFNIGEFRKEEKMIKKLKTLLGLADDAGEDKAVEAVTILVDRNRELEGKQAAVACSEVLAALGAKEGAGKDEVIRIIASLKAPGDVAKELSLQVAKLTQEIAEMKQTDLIELALKEGKTSPEELDKWGRNLAKTNPEQFRLIVLSRPAGSVVPVQDIKIAAKNKTGELDDVQRNINAMCGVDDETFKKYNK